ncbi:MAG: hypothetical protein EOR67_30050 [Mesorhizobium sp.]|uniref:hypothetical protein n=1 Tax=Mesorhizobium sp. TaxID=1871066 RepID=UPI000FE83A2D|nr:hypothetical protein [Mesorhizobium sp.]RWL81373.1 MAG: hypothetical protein EOR67_30050 [Mesorhizobium sp.]
MEPAAASPPRLTDTASQETRSPAVWRIHRAGHDDSDLWLAFEHPAPLRLVLERGTHVPQLPGVDELLTFVHLLPGIETPSDIQKQFEAWVAQGDAEAPYLDVSGRSVRLVWKGHRCLAYTGSQGADDCIAAAVMFSHLHGTLLAEETRLELAWQAMTDDAALTHDVRRVALREQGRVNGMTRQFQTARIAVSRMDIALQRPELTMSPAARRLFSELALQADLASRIRLLDDAVEVGEDLYERANDRLIEHRNYLVEVWIETAILLAILAELAVLLFDFFSK